MNNVHLIHITKFLFFQKRELRELVPCTRFNYTFFTEVETDDYKDPSSFARKYALHIFKQHFLNRARDR